MTTALRTSSPVLAPALVLGAALALTCGVAQAAAADADGWSGAYAGLVAGAQNTSTKYALPGDTADALQSDHASKTSAFGGAVLGFDHQSGNMVLGVDAQVVGGSNRQGVTACTVPDGCWVSTHDSFTTLNRFKEGANGRIRLRAGIAKGDTLFYVAGGYSLAKTRLDLVGLCFNPGNPGTPLVFNFSRSKTLSGFNLGAGVERRIGGHLSVRAEYVFDDFGRQLYRGDGSEWNDRRISVHNSDLQAAVTYRF
jgi:outer membrane immunogenic protein